MAVHQVRVGPLPEWMDIPRLLGPTDEHDGTWELSRANQPVEREASPHAGRRPSTGGRHGREENQGLDARATLTRSHAADVAARLRGLGFDGRAIGCEIDPPLPRTAVRQARTDDARRRRATTPGFLLAGTRDDEVGRMSLTPESLAMRIAGWAQGRAVVDAGCGIGGNTIAFARAGCSVIAIESDAARLELARHNAKVYGVASKIEFVHGDATTILRERSDGSAILFVDPPWGADWPRDNCGLAELPLLGAVLPYADGYAALWAKLPPSFATSQLLDGRPGRVDAMFGEAPGDHRRVKFVLVRRPA